MSNQPNQIWSGLSVQFQDQIKEELISIAQEVLNDDIRTHHSTSSDPQSGHLHSSIAPHQVLSHQESLRLQYSLRQRAISLGWRETDIETIDTDLGLSATSTDYREGFQGLFAGVALGEIGIILSSDVMRLCRNCSDWYPLLDICGCKGCLIADNDGVYDPGSPNGRLLLGLKGQLSE